MSSLRGALASGERTIPYAIELQGQAATVHVAGGQISLDTRPLLPGVWAVHCGGRRLLVRWAIDGSRICLHADGQTYEFHRVRSESLQAGTTVTGGPRSPESRPAASAPGSPAAAGPAAGLPPVLPEEADPGISPRVVAAITAALSTYLGRPVAAVPRATPTAAGSWVALGRQLQLRSRRVGSR